MLMFKTHISKLTDNIKHSTLKIYILVSSMFFAKLLIFTGTVVPQFFLALLATSTADITSHKNTGYILSKLN